MRDLQELSQVVIKKFILSAVFDVRKWWMCEMLHRMEVLGPVELRCGKRMTAQDR